MKRTMTVVRISVFIFALVLGAACGADGPTSKVESGRSGRDMPSGDEGGNTVGGKVPPGDGVGGESVPRGDGGARAGAPNAPRSDTTGGTPQQGTDRADSSAACALSSSYASLSAVTGTTAYAQEDDGALSVSFEQEMDEASPSVLMIEVWSGYGLFENGLGPGTFPITGDETHLGSCSACVYIGVGADEGSEDLPPQHLLVASGGVLVIDEVSSTANGRFRGSLSQVTFREVSVDPTTDAEQDVPGGCRTAIGAFSFDALVVHP